MKKFLLFVLLSFFAFFSFADVLRVKNKAEIYSSPSTSSKVLTSLDNFKYIEGNLSEKITGWYEVKVGNQNGYISKSSVSVELLDYDFTYDFDNLNRDEIAIANGTGVLGSIASFVEFHPIWSVIIAILLCIFSPILVYKFTIDKDDENPIFIGLFVIDIISVILTVIGIVGIFYRPSGINAKFFKQF